MKLFLNKFFLHQLVMVNNYENVMEINKIKKVHLNFGFRSDGNKFNFLAAFCFYRLLFGVKARFNKSKSSLLVLRIRKGSVVGCSVVLFNNFLNFFCIYIIDILNTKNFEFNKKGVIGSSYSFFLKDFSILKKIEFFFEYFYNLPRLDISFVLLSKNLDGNIKFLRIVGINFV